MKTLIATPSKAYQNDRGLTLVQKDITFMGGAWEVVEIEGKGRALRVTANTDERKGKHYETKEEIPLPSVADEIQEKLIKHYGWGVEEV